MTEISGRPAVVTGAGSGIGRATALALAAEGARVIAADIDGETAERTAADCAAVGAAVGGAGAGYRVDVSDAAAMEGFAATVLADHGAPGIVVNNAGIAVLGSFMETSVADWRNIIGVNLWGVIHGSRLFGAQMRQAGHGGHIVNIASAASFAPTRSLAAYCTTKAAVLMLSDCLRAELAKDRIGVTAICPGFVHTGIATHASFTGGEGERADRLRALAERGLTMRRYPPERVAGHIVTAIRQNKAVVPVNFEGHVIAAMSRLSPGSLRLLARLPGPF